MTRPALRFVLGDQLSLELSSLEDADRARDRVLMVEVGEEATYVRHHQQKLVLVFSAMRHFAAQLRTQGFHVDYVRLDDPDNTHTLTRELQRALARHPDCERVVTTEPGEWRVRAMLEQWPEITGLPVEIRDDTRFLCTRAEFARWAGDRRQLRMEYFYREMRRRTGWLMSKDSPVGGRWNFDSDNRKRLPAGLAAVPRRATVPDDITREVIELVRSRFATHFGDLEPFHWAVTRDEALERLAEFVAQSLPNFGDYQDAMQSADDFLFHSALSPYLNLGLLTAREVCEAALEAWGRGRAPLNAVEGFIRQILGWREFVRGIYWLRMPEYADSNFLEAQRPLPAFYWTGETSLRCLRLCIDSTRRHAYAHHIQRLMVTGNFALLAGIAPAAVEEWYLLVYADAYEWVELPNTHGMALHADGGQLGSKPYAASGAYLRRMSDYCDGCAYDPAIKSGPRACPFNYLYWHFLMRNEQRLGRNPRLAMPYRSLRALSLERRAEITRDAEAFLQELH